MGFRTLVVTTVLLAVAWASDVTALSFVSLFQEPAPITLLLLGAGAAGLGWLVRRRRKAPLRS